MTGISSSLSESSSLLVSISFSGLPVLAWVVMGPVFSGVAEMGPFLDIPLAETEAALTGRPFPGVVTWLGRPAGASSSLSESSSLLSDSAALVAAALADAGVTFPSLVGPEAVLAGGSLAGVTGALACGGFAEGFTSTSVSSLELEVSSLELLAWPADTVPGLAVGPRTWALPSSSVSEAKTMLAKGSADFLGDFPDSSWTAVFPDAGGSTEFTVLLAVLVFAFCFMFDGKAAAMELIGVGLGVALVVSVSASSSSSSELSELLIGSDTLDFLACSVSSFSAFCFRPSSEVCCQCV